MLKTNLLTGIMESISLGICLENKGAARKWTISESKPWWRTFQNLPRDVLFYYLAWKKWNYFFSCLFGISCIFLQFCHIFFKVIWLAPVLANAVAGVLLYAWPVYCFSSFNFRKLATIFGYFCKVFFSSRDLMNLDFLQVWNKQLLCGFPIFQTYWENITTEQIDLSSIAGNIFHSPTWAPSVLYYNFE